MNKRGEAASDPPPGGAEPDFKLLLERAPGLFLVLTGDFQVASVSDAYAAAVGLPRLALVGHSIFDAFADAGFGTGAIEALRESLQRVMRTGSADAMPVQRREVAASQDAAGIAVRHWRLHNAPVPGLDGRLANIIHWVEDVTDSVDGALRILEAPAPEGGSDEAFAGTLRDADLGAAYAAAKHFKPTGKAPASQERRARFAAAFRSSPVGILIVRMRDGVVVDANAACSWMFGYTRGELVGRRLDELGIYDAVEEGRILAHLSHYGRIANAERQFRRKSGASGWSLTSAEIIDIDGEDHVVSFQSDISETVEAVSALADSEARLNSIVGSAMDAIVVVDDRQNVVLFNPAAERMFRCSSTEAVGRPYLRLLPERFHDACRRFGEATRAGWKASQEEVFGPDLCGLRADGTEFPVEVSMSAAVIAGRVMLTAIIRDIGDRRAAEHALRESHRQLRDLSASLQTVRERERARIARELHDELGQRLTGLKLELSWLGSRLADCPPETREKVDHMKALVGDTVATVRRISYELRPPVLDDLGLGAAIDWLAEDFAERTGVLVNQYMDAAIDGMPEQAGTSVFRIIQECLTNVARHAEATAVRISVRQAGDVLDIEVADDGNGRLFESKRLTHSLGLVGIRERALMLGGDMEIVSAPELGTSVSVRIPWPVADTERNER